ncbi:hypothetical protein BURMUCGD1_4795 [Burkholderia multivorans CGD1]|nr:hypothetical protein BURMUCGD1_4795 [Burkholderia multivorans CGD1]
MRRARRGEPSNDRADAPPLQMRRFPMGGGNGAAWPRMLRGQRTRRGRNAGYRRPARRPRTPTACRIACSARAVCRRAARIPAIRAGALEPFG